VAKGGLVCYVNGMTNALNRRNLLTLGAAAMFAKPAVSAAHRPVVMELFTSQGCSSCPPADAYLETLKGKPGLVALSYHVDYWDYLGWRDTLSSAEFSQRQYDYAAARGDRNVYTPQAIVNGADHFVGSQRSAVSGGIADAKSKPSNEWVDISMSDNKTDVMIAVAGHAARRDATLWLMAYAPEISVEIKKGENAGRTIIYHNVVRKIVPAGMWHGDEAKLVLPRSSVIPKDCKGWVALLQTGKVGPVIGVATGGANS
jgi:hypothetical protein